MDCFCWIRGSLRLLSSQLSLSTPSLLLRGLDPSVLKGVKRVEERRGTAGWLCGWHQGPQRIWNLGPNGYALCSVRSDALVPSSEPCYY